MSKNLGLIILAIILLIVVFVGDNISEQDHRSELNEIFVSKGYTVVEIDRTVIDRGPFMFSNKHAHHYKITYKHNGVTKIAYARYDNGLFSKDKIVYDYK